MGAILSGVVAAVLLAATSAVGTKTKTPGLEVQLDGPAEVRAGEKVQYKLRVTNTGNVALPGYTPDLWLPAESSFILPGVKWVSIGDSSSSEGKPFLKIDHDYGASWSPPNAREKIAPGESKEATFELVTTRPGPFTIKLDVRTGLLVDRQWVNVESKPAFHRATTTDR
jgi:hypothetical protein